VISGAAAVTATHDAPSPRRRTTGEFLRFVAVGAWNTVFGYGTFAAFNWLLTGHAPYPYLVANVLANVVAISVAFMLYKRVVFRARGNTLREFLRVNMVYLATAAAGLLALPWAVKLAALTVPEAAAPYVGQAMLVPVATLVSYLGHRHYSFAPGGNGAS